MFTRPLTYGLIAISVIGISFGQQYVIDFDYDDDGILLTAGAVDVGATQPYANVFDAGVGLILSTNNPSSKPLNLYDSEGTGGQDNDLERNSTGSGQWDGGSLTTESVDNLLIVNTNTNLAVPNDNGGGGQLILTFQQPLEQFGFDFIDLDSSANATLRFSDSASGNAAAIPFAWFEQGSGQTAFERTGVQFGDRHGNRVLGITAGDLALTQFDEVIFDMTSSGGIGTLYVDVVPEPTGSSMLIAAMASACTVRRRKSQA